MDAGPVRAPRFPAAPAAERITSRLGGGDQQHAPKGATAGISSGTAGLRGNVATRLQKLMDRSELDATVLALAGLTRLNFAITPEGRLTGDAVPDGLLATVLETDVMLPCVGQGAIGIEVRADDERIAAICQRLNHHNTLQCATAERAFLAAMGGGCQSPVGAHAEVAADQLHMRVISFIGGTVRRAEARRSLQEPVALGEELAATLKS